MFTMIPLLVKSRVHMFSLSYRNFLGSQFLFSLLLNQLSWCKGLIFFFLQRYRQKAQRFPPNSGGVP